MIAVHTAPALTGPWTYNGAALPEGSIIDKPGNQDLWAPEVILDGDTYHMYYSVSAFGSQDSAIGVATSATMDDGTWTDLGSTGVDSVDGDPYNAINPSMINIDGAWSMNFGSFWEGIFQVPMDGPEKSSGGPSQIAYDFVTTALEGVAMLKNGDYYYLFFSKGSCCSYDADMPAAGEEYNVMVCRSASPTGGFVDQDGTACTEGGGTVVLESHGVVYGPGGQGVFEDPEFGPVVYYHYVNTDIGYADGDKQFGWNTMDFSTGWPVV